MVGRESPGSEEQFGGGDHVRVAAEEDIGAGGVELEVGREFDDAIFEEGLDAADGALEVGILFGAGDGGDVGEVGADAGEAFEFAAVAEVPAVAGAMEDDEFAVGILDEEGAEHGDVGGEAGAGGDEDDGLLGGDAVEGEEAGGLGGHEEACAVGEGEQARGELAAVDERDEELGVAAFDAGGGNAVGAPDHLVLADGRLLGVGLGHAGLDGLEAEDGELAGFEIEQGVVRLDAEDMELGVDDFAAGEGGVVGWSGGAHAGAGFRRGARGC